MAVVAIFLAACSTRPPAPDVGFVSSRLADRHEPTVAVLPFDNKSGYLGAERLVADEVNLRIGMTNRFRMIERMRVKELYREQDFDPRRVEDTTAARIGRMLGAQIVILGTVTNYKIADRPPEIPADVFPVLSPVAAPGDEAVSLVANTLAALIAFLSMRQPVAEVGVSMRMVDAETGEILWQARNNYRGNDPLLTKRRPRNEWDRLRKDVTLLTSVLVSDMVETMK